MAIDDKALEIAGSSRVQTRRVVESSIPALFQAGLPPRLSRAPKNWNLLSTLRQD